MLQPLVITAEQRRRWQAMYYAELMEAVATVEARHGPWCGSLEEWVELVEQTRSDLETHLALKGAGLL